jgi:hypothetical protein
MANIDPNTGLAQTGVATPTLGVQPTVPPLVQPVYTPGQNFQFDPTQATAQATAQASSIYDPQKAQIEALNKISQAQTAQTKITTEKQFADELTARIEAINARGAFFGGGAIDQQNDLGQRKTSALTNLDLNQQSADLSAQAQQAGLNAQQIQYIQDKVSGAQGSAYSMWKDSYGMWQDKENARIQAESVAYQKEQDKIAQANADRDYQLALQRIADDKKASKAAKKAAEKEAKRRHEEEIAKINAK